MLETVTKSPSSPWYYTHLRKMSSLQWEKLSFSWQRPSPAYKFSLCLSNMLIFPSWSHPKVSLHVLWGFCPQQTSEVPQWQWLPGYHTALGKGSVPISRPSTDGASKAFASYCGLGALQSKEGIDSVPLLPQPCSRDIQGEDSKEPAACPGLPPHNTLGSSRPEVCTCLPILRTTWLQHVHPKNHPAASLFNACTAEVEGRRHFSCWEVGCMCVMNC